MKRVLITGVNSYVGSSLKKHLEKIPGKYDVETISVRNDGWKQSDFSDYATVVHVAALVHQKKLKEEAYYQVNTVLTYELAKKAKESGVNQFIFMSTMAVYGTEGTIGGNTVINLKTETNPKSHYAKSKVEAENQIQSLKSEEFKISIIRAPIIYGENCPGNFSLLKKLAPYLKIFPLINNCRSMLHVDNLCIHIEEYIDKKSEGLFLLQDEDYTNTSMLVKKLSESSGKKVYLSKTLGFIIVKFGKKSGLLSKVFGNLTYEKY